VRSDSAFVDILQSAFNFLKDVQFMHDVLKRHVIV